MLSGPIGIGKSHLAKSVSYFLSCRYYFLNGNYYFDLREIKTAEQLKKMIKDEKCDYLNEETLLVLDHCDLIWKKHGAQFRWWVLDIANRFKTSILIVTRDNISNELMNENIVKSKSFELGPLNEYESADLLLAVTNRIITKDELHMNSEMTIHEALEHEPNLIN